MIFISCLLFSGMVVMSLSMTRHHLQMRRKKIAKRYVFHIRSAAWLLLSLSMVLSVTELGLGIGLAFFFGIVSLVSFVQVLLLSYAPRTLIPLAVILPLISGLSWLTT